MSKSLENNYKLIAYFTALTIAFVIIWILETFFIGNGTVNELHYLIVKDSVNYTIYNEDNKPIVIFKEGDIPQLDSIFIKDNL